jgi:hypothetical protein
MDEITKIIIEANKERRIINLDDIRNICYYIGKKNGFKPFNDIKISDKCSIVDEEGTRYTDENMLGFYNKSENALYYFYDTILDFSLEKANKFKNEYSQEGTPVDVLNYYFLTLILHELVHVKQDYLVKSVYNGFEKKILSIFNEFSSGDEIYDNNQFDIITEVNARNESVVNAFNIYSNLPKNFFTEYDKGVYQLSMLKQLFYSNYDVSEKDEEVYGPAERMGDVLTDQMLAPFNMDISDYARLIYGTNRLTLYNKLMYGLPISLNEYAYGNLLISELSSGLNINAIKKLQKRI